MTRKSVFCKNICAVRNGHVFVGCSEMIERVRKAIGLAVCAAFLGLSQSAAAACLDRSNDKVFLSKGEVYSNGKLKFRIVEYFSSRSPRMPTQIRVRSNARGLDSDYVQLWEEPLTKSDNTLCSGAEIQVTCTGRDLGDRGWNSNEGYFSCTFSEF